MFFGNGDQGGQDGVVVVFLDVTCEPWAWRWDWKVKERWCLYRQSCETLGCLSGMYVQWSIYQWLLCSNLYRKLYNLRRVEGMRLLSDT
jgi:hypothetical protein